MLKMMEINFNLFISVKIKQLQSQLLLYLTQGFYNNYLMPVISWFVIVPDRNHFSFF